jgi:hypothetical protein
MTEKEIDLQKKEIEALGLNAIKDYFKVDVSKLDKDTLIHLHQKAKIGMGFEREMSLSKRAVEMNYLRVFKLIAQDKKEIKKLIKKSLPHYLS